jgi:hypothetical protein
VKIECHCGALLVDHTDALPNKAHYIPDQGWDAVLVGLEAKVVDPLTDRRLTRDGAYQRAREIVIPSARGMWQCSTCGRLYVDDAAGKLNCFEPRDETTDRGVLRAAGLED